MTCILQRFTESKPKISYASNPQKGSAESSLAAVSTKVKIFLENPDEIAMYEKLGSCLNRLSYDKLSSADENNEFLLDNTLRSVISVNKTKISSNKNEVLVPKQTSEKQIKPSDINSASLTRSPVEPPVVKPDKLTPEQQLKQTFTSFKPFRLTPLVPSLIVKPLDTNDPDEEESKSLRETKYQDDLKCDERSYSVKDTNERSHSRNRSSFRRESVYQTTRNSQNRWRESGSVQCGRWEYIEQNNR